MPDSQLAYRQFYSTETALSAVVNDLLVLMDESNCGILIFLEYKIVFVTYDIFNLRFIVSITPKLDY